MSDLGGWLRHKGINSIYIFIQPVIKSNVEPLFSCALLGLDFFFSLFVLRARTILIFYQFPPYGSFFQTLPAGKIRWLTFWLDRGPPPRNAVNRVPLNVLRGTKGRCSQGAAAIYKSLSQHSDATLSASSIFPAWQQRKQVHKPFRKYRTGCLPFICPGEPKETAHKCKRTLAFGHEAQAPRSPSGDTLRFNRSLPSTLASELEDLLIPNPNRYGWKPPCTCFQNFTTLSCTFLTPAEIPKITPVM